MAKGLIALLLDSIFDANWTGRHGEKLTERELKLVRFFGRDGNVLRNIYVPKDNGETSEIDVVYITQKGIFVIESKNYSGWIFGDEKSAYWTAMLPNKTKNRFYNPIKQNKTHIKWLGQYLNGEVPLYSIIVFSERCELKKVTVDSPDIKVIQRDRLYAAVRDIWDKTEDKLNKEQLESIYETLEILTHVDNATKMAHIDHINEKYKNNSYEVSTTPCAPAVKEEIPSENLTAQPEDAAICPKCGGALVLRMAKKGPNAGNQFYGCSNYPKCRYTKNID